MIGVRGRAEDIPKLVFALLAHFADVVLRVQLETELGDEIELGLEKVDMVFLHRKHFLLFSCQDIGPALHFGTSKDRIYAVRSIASAIATVRRAISA